MSGDLYKERASDSWKPPSSQRIPQVGAKSAILELGNQMEVIYEINKNTVATLGGSCTWASTTYPWDQSCWSDI